MHPYYTHRPVQQFLANHTHSSNPDGILTYEDHCTTLEDNINTNTQKHSIYSVEQLHWEFLIYTFTITIQVMPTSRISKSNTPRYSIHASCELRQRNSLHTN